MNRWQQAVRSLDLGGDGSFDLDFHTIPYHGDTALLEKHSVSKRSRRQKGMLAFLASDADARLPCYANANVSKHDQNDEILRFVEFRFACRDWIGAAQSGLDCAPQDSSCPGPAWRLNG